MRPVLALAIAALAASACRAAEPPATKPDRSPVVLDVRTNGERRRGYVPRSRHVPLAELRARLGELADVRDRPIVTLCAGGSRARDAAEILRVAGFSDVSVFEGGMAAWHGPLEGARLDPDGLPFQDRFRVGASFLVRREPGDAPPGLVVETAYPAAPAHDVLRFGDVVTAIDGAPLDPAALAEPSYARLFPPKDAYRLRVRRGGEERDVLLDARRETHDERAASLHGDGALDAFRGRFLDPDAGGIEGVARAAAPHLASWWPTGPAIANAVVADPGRAWELPGAVWPGALPRSPREAVDASLDRASALLGIETSSVPPMSPPRDAAELARILESLVRANDDAIRAQTSGLDERSRGALARGPRLFPALTRRAFVVDDPDDDAVRAAIDFGDAARKVALAPAIEAARSFARLADPAVVTRLVAIAKTAPTRPAPEDRGVSGSIAAWVETADGPIVVGGPGANAYRGRFAAIVDLGGDDTYDFPGGLAPALLFDVAGDDRVRQGGDLGDDARFFGAHVAIDLAGDDRWQGGSYALGAGFLGASVLVDAAGDDAYDVGSFGLGAGSWGVGIVVDLAGRDRYRGGRGTQGFGGPGGVGALIDASGDDGYDAVATDAADFPRATFAQGCGMGVRELSLGGVGVLVDGGGDDRYAAIEYAQGVGYFGGLGVLEDRGGRDRYAATKYAQAAGVHGGIGLLDDRAGDDRYELLGDERGQAIGWDMGVALLVDRGGDDTFVATKLAQAYAAQNGFATLATLGDESSFACDDASLCGAKTGPSTYAGGRGAGSVALRVGRR